EGLLGLGLLAVLVATAADEDRVTRGAAVYGKSCGVAYCHGPEGKAGRAPALAGRGLAASMIVAVATGGIPNTGMPGFGRQLKPEDLEAVAAYIVSLGGNTANPATGSGEGRTVAAGAMGPAVQQGRALFFDATRGRAC